MSATGCLVNSGLTISCGKLGQTGGVKPRFWVFNLDDLTTQIDVSSTVGIAAITFNTYKGLHKYVGPTEGHQAGWELVASEGGNNAIRHNAIVKLIEASNADNDIIKRLLSGSAMGFIFELNNKKFRIYGAQSGMIRNAGVQNQGINNAADVSSLLTFQGNGEEHLPLYFVNTDFNTSLTTLIGYEV